MLRTFLVQILRQIGQGVMIGYKNRRTNTQINQRLLPYIKIFIAHFVKLLEANEVMVYRVMIVR